MWLQILFASSFYFGGVIGQGHVGLKIEGSPTVDNFKFTLGREIRIHCVVDKSIVGKDYSNWGRELGNTPIQAISKGVSLATGFDSNRYTVDRRQSTVNTNLFVYTLIIRDAHYEDAGTMVCYTGLGRSIKQNIAICSDVENKVCSCMLEQGMSSPVCFQEPSSCTQMEAYKRSAVGLGICLAIVIAFGIIMAALLGKDCLSTLRRRRKHRDERTEHERRVRLSGTPRNIYADSERLTLDPNDPDNTSTPESGVWSNSGGSQGDGNGNTRPNGRAGVRAPEPVSTQPPLAHSTPPSERVPTQTHINKAYEGEAGEPPSYTNALIHNNPPDSKPKRKKKSGSRPKTHAPTPLSLAVQNATSREKLNISTSSVEPLHRAPSSEVLNQEPSPNQSMSGYAQHPTIAPTAHVDPNRSPYQASPHQGHNMYPQYDQHSPYPPQHVPSVSAGVSPHASRYNQPGYPEPQAPPRGTYSSPRELQFMQQPPQQQHRDGPYVDSHDTVI